MTSRVNGISTDRGVPSSRTSATECARSRMPSASRQRASRISRERHSPPGPPRHWQPSSPRSRPAIWTTSTPSPAAPKPLKPRSSSRGSTGWKAVVRASRTSFRSPRATTATRCSQCPHPRVRTTRRSFASGLSTCIACPRPSRTTARVAETTRSARRAPARSSRRRFWRSARIASPPSLRSRWADRRLAQPFRATITGERCARFCDRHGVLFIADEVACGAGRTGTWSALEPYSVAPDIMTMGKGIAGGYTPLSAVAAPRRIVDVIARGSGALAHAQTFSHHPVLCAAGLATVRYLREHALVARAATMGRVFHEKLAALLDTSARGRRAGPRHARGYRARARSRHANAVPAKGEDGGAIHRRCAPRGARGVVERGSRERQRTETSSCSHLRSSIEPSQMDELLTRFRAAYDASVSGALATT